MCEYELGRLEERLRSCIRVVADEDFEREAYGRDIVGSIDVERVSAAIDWTESTST